MADGAEGLGGWKIEYRTRNTEQGSGGVVEWRVWRGAGDGGVQGGSEDDGFRISDCGWRVGMTAVRSAGATGE